MRRCGRTPFGVRKDELACIVEGLRIGPAALPTIESCAKSAASVKGGAKQSTAAADCVTKAALAAVGPKKKQWSDLKAVQEGCSAYGGTADSKRCLKAANKFMVEPMPVLTRCLEAPFRRDEAIRFDCLESGQLLGATAVDDIDNCYVETKGTGKSGGQDSSMLLDCLDDLRASRAAGNSKSGK